MRVFIVNLYQTQDMQLENVCVKSKHPIITEINELCWIKNTVAEKEDFQLNSVKWNGQ